ncbi:MAG: SufE family protein [Alsobacter sp.]
MSGSIDDILENFSYLDDWDDRYRYLIELGRSLEPLPDAAHNEQNRVRGCASQVWIESRVEERDGRRVLAFRGDSDAHIVKGLVALTLALFSGRDPQSILETDAAKVYADLGLSEHLTPQRSNGVRSMVERIKADARSALAAGG